MTASCCTTPHQPSAWVALRRSQTDGGPECLVHEPRVAHHGGAGGGAVHGEGVVGEGEKR